MLVLDTVAATTLAAAYDASSNKPLWTVETTIKSLVGMDAQTLRDLADLGEKSDLLGHRKAAFVARVALALQAERAAAHVEALAVHHAGTTECDGCAGDGVFRFPGGCFENGVWKGKTGPCFRCGGTGRQTTKDGHRNRYYDNHVRGVYA